MENNHNQKKPMNTPTEQEEQRLADIACKMLGVEEMSYDNFMYACANTTVTKVTYQCARWHLSQVAAKDERIRKLETILEAMLGNYIELKRISLAVARSDNPEWMTGITPEDDVHIIAIRAALKTKEAGK